MTAPRTCIVCDTLTADTVGVVVSHGLPVDRCANCHLRPTWAGDGTDDPLCWECALARSLASPMPGSCDLCGERHGRWATCGHVRGRMDGLSPTNPEGGARWADPVPRPMVTDIEMRSTDEWAS